MCSLGSRGRVSRCGVTGRVGLEARALLAALRVEVCASALDEVRSGLFPRGFAGARRGTPKRAGGRWARFSPRRRHRSPGLPHGGAPAPGRAGPGPAAISSPLGRPGAAPGGEAVLRRLQGVPVGPAWRRLPPGSGAARQGLRLWRRSARRDTEPEP